MTEVVQYWRMMEWWSTILRQMYQLIHCIHPLLQKQTNRQVMMEMQTPFASQFEDMLDVCCTAAVMTMLQMKNHVILYKLNRLQMCV